jgi:hypothetical protein
MWYMALIQRTFGIVPVAMVARKSRGACRRYRLAAS